MLLKKILISSILSLLLFGFVAQAAIADDTSAGTTVQPNSGPVGIQNAGNVLGKTAGKTGLKGDLSLALGTVIQGVLAVVGTIFFIMMVYAGVLWTSARGVEEQVTKAKGIITAAIIGLVITLGAYAITAFVSGRLGGA